MKVAMDQAGEFSKPRSTDLAIVCGRVTFTKTTCAAWTSIDAHSEMHMKTLVEKDGKMLFLIEYDRNEGHIIALTSFPDSDKEIAEGVWLELELSLNRRGIENEVVILDAATEEALRRTHRRYFEDLAELATVPGD